jgi:hypothetical protein
MMLQTDLTDYLNTQAPAIVRQFPTVTIKKGQASINEPQPYFIRDKKTGRPLMIIDTTGGISTLKGTTASILVTKKSIIVRKDANETRSFDLTGVDNYTIDKTDIYNLIDSLEGWFAVMIFPFALFISFVFHSVEALIYAMIGTLFLRQSHFSLPFRSLFRLAVISITPAMVTGTVLLIAGMDIPYWWTLSFMVSLSYLYYAVRASSEKEGSDAS